MPESPSRGRAAPAERGAGRAAADAPRVQVRYYKRMRLGRVYPVQVGWARGTRGPVSGPVTVRLVMAGAQVVPLEQPLDTSRPDARATFHVTPIARGWLRGERVEVLREGRKIDEVKLPCKVTSQRCTWFLLFLTFFIPFWVAPLFTREGALVEDEPPARRAREADPAPHVPGGALTVRLRRWAPPVLPVIEENLPADVTNALYDVPGYLGEMYQYLYLMCDNNDIRLGYWSFWVLLVLTFLSWWWHLPGQKRRKGAPLTALARVESE
jgi:hypothetical protein